MTSDVSFEDLLSVVEHLPAWKRQDYTDGYRVWFGNDMAYGVDYTHTGEPYRITRFDTHQTWITRLISGRMPPEEPAE